MLLALCATTLACYSSDTLFIHLTPTPLPTPVPPTPESASAFQVGQRVVIAGQGVAAVYLTRNPEPQTRRNRVPNAACYPKATVEILAVQAIDGVTYYQIACNDTPGWVEEARLAAS
jgi:hypothetical protein